MPATRVFELWALFCYPLGKSDEALAIASLRSKQPKPLALYVPDRFPPCALYGSTGSGKTTCYAGAQLFDCGDRMIVLDGKGELAKLSAKHRAKKFGHEIAVIDPYGVASGCGFPAARINPPDLFRRHKSRIVDEARRLATSLVVTTGEEKDPFRVQSSNMLITATLSFLMGRGASRGSESQPHARHPLDSGIDRRDGRTYAAPCVTLSRQTPTK